MKMTKIEFWRKVKEKCENEMIGCYWIICNKECPYYVAGLENQTKECKLIEDPYAISETLALAESYIKRHEQKSKKKSIFVTPRKRLKNRESRLNVWSVNILESVS